MRSGEAAARRACPCENQRSLSAASPNKTLPRPPTEPAPAEDARYASGRPRAAGVARRALLLREDRRSAAPSREQALRDSLLALLGSRLLVWASGVGVVLLLGFGPTRKAYDPRALTSHFGDVGNVLAATAARWDGAWYLTIAKYGYLPQLGHFTQSRAAFFPLYPLLLSLVSRFGLPGALAGAIVSLLALLAACYALHRLVALELKRGRLRGAWTASPLHRASASLREGGSEREVARLAVCLLAFSPMAFFLSADYSESLYLALSIGLFLAARHGRWLWVGVLGGLAAATRSTGIVLLAPALLLYLYGPREDLAPRERESAGAPRSRALRLREFARPRYAVRADVLWLALIPAGLLAFIAYLALSGGEALAPFHAQASWGRHFAGPFAAVLDGARAAFEGARQLISGQSRHLYFPLEGKSPSIEASHNLMLFAFLALAAPACVGVLRRLPLAYGVYVLAALALPLSYPVATQPLMSLPRFLLVLFPLFMWLAAHLASRPRARIAVVVVFALALAAFTAQFSTWHWVS
ncbi:MAG: mannosyltransferase family protein [Solirubrobacteraceae bacterium]